MELSTGADGFPLFLLQSRVLFPARMKPGISLPVAHMLIFNEAKFPRGINESTWGKSGV